MVADPERGVRSNFVRHHLSLVVIILEVVLFRKPMAKVSVVFPLFTGNLVINVVGYFMSGVKI